MVQINFAKREIRAKIVYYGPALAGKTTNLEVIHKKAGARCGELVSISTEGDKTLSMTYQPLDLGKVGGMDTIFDLYTVPGEVYYNATKKLVLQGADGIVFVADASKDRLEANVESIRNLEENLQEQGLDIKTIPLVLMWNKMDLPDALNVEDLNGDINQYDWPTFEGVAVTGEGVFPVIKKIAQLVLEKLNKEYGMAPRAAARAKPAAPPAPDPYAADEAAEEMDFQTGAAMDFDMGAADDEMSFGAPAAPPAAAAPPPAAAMPAPAPPPDMQVASRSKASPPARSFSVAGASASPGGGSRRKLRRSEAPSGPPAGTFSRSATVRYYRQMYPLTNYPLMVALSREKIQQVAIKHVGQVASKKKLTIKKENPLIHIRVVLPGCLITPAERELDVTPDKAEARFWVTPLALGKLDDARVELTYEGKLVDTILIPTRVTKQTLAKLSALSGAVSPVLKPVINNPNVKAQLEGAGTQAGDQVVAWLAANGFYVVAGVFALMAIVFYIWKRPKKSDPVKSFFDI